MTPTNKKRAAATFALASLAACGGPKPTPPPPGCDPNAAGWTVWVTNQGLGVDSVTVFRNHGDDKIVPQFLATIPVGRAPHNIAFAPDGRFAYVANLGTPPAKGSVSVIDTRSHQVVATVEAGIKSHGLAVTPDGRSVWVANENSNDLTVIDTATNAADVKTIPVGQGPLMVAFTLDGSKAYVSCGKDATVWVIDVATRTPLKWLRTGAGAMGLAMRPDGKLCFETEGLDNRVSVIDTSTDAVANVLTYDGTLVECHGVAMAGHEVLFTNRTAQSLVFAENRSLEKLSTLAIVGRPDIIATSPNCDRAYFTLRDRPAVAVVDIPDRRYLDTVDLGTGDTHGIGVLKDAN